jgi:hypothetical protein
MKNKINENSQRISAELILVEDGFFVNSTLLFLDDTLIQNLRTIHTLQFFVTAHDDFARCYAFH